MGSVVKMEKMALNIQISVLIILTLAFLSPAIHGWGVDGHFIICTIAQVPQFYIQISCFPLLFFLFLNSKFWVSLLKSDDLIVVLFKVFNFFYG